MKKQLCMMLCAAAMLCSMACPALAVDADTITESAGETLPLLVPASAAVYPAEVRASEENGIAHLEKVYYLTAKDDLQASEEKVMTASNDLFSAYNTYCWAVQHGILN